MKHIDVDRTFRKLKHEDQDSKELCENMGIPHEVLKEQGTQVLILEPRGELTKKMGEDAGMDEPVLSKATEIAEGNPGMMNYLIQIWKEVDEVSCTCLLACLKARNLGGSSLYTIIKGRGGADKAIEDFRYRGWL